MKGTTTNVTYLNQRSSQQSIFSLSLALVAHTCNPRYSGGREQKAHGSKPALGKQFERQYLKKTKRG
jgi:hypothetical protein